MKIFRLWGIIVFFVLGLMTGLTWYLFAPQIIASGIEDLGSEALGAKVEVDQVELSLFPLKISINNLKAADPADPMKNLFEASKVRFAVDSASLLWKKILIDELTIEGIQLGTSRQVSGKLDGGRVTGQVASRVASFDMPKLTEEDIKKLVDQADLVTVKRLETLNKTQQVLQTEWKTALNQENYQIRTEAIEMEFNRLKKRAKENKMNVISDYKAWKKLKKNIDKERKIISDLNNKLKKDRQTLENQVNSVRRGPKEDLNAIMEKTGLGNGISGLSDKFLGPQLTPWIKKAIEMVRGMEQSETSTEEAPVYSTNRGLLVKFKDEQIFPDLLIKKINLSGKDSHWELSGNGTDIGYFPWLTGKPANLNLNFEGNGSANILINSHWPSSKEMKTTFESKITNWNISDMKLMQTNNGNWQIKSGTLNSSIKGYITLKDIDLKLSLKLDKPQIIAPKGLSGWQKNLSTSLSQQNTMDIELTATGSLLEPSIKISSSLEKLFTGAIGDKLKQQAEKFKDKYATAISNKVGDLSSLDSVGDDIEKWGKQLKVNDDLLKKLKSKIL